MATIGNTYFDLIDLYKSQDPKGQIAPVIEMLAEMNPILDDAMAVQCNNGTKHLTTVRTGLPSVTWGKLYQGIPQGKSTKAQVEDTTGFVEGLSSIDSRLLKLAGGKEGAIRLSEAQAYLESMNQEIANKIFYGNSASDPEQFMGLTPRFNDPTASNGNQIINGGGTGADNTSIWFVTWGDNTCHLLYPEGTQAGVKREDKGEQRILDDNGNAYYVKEEMFSWHCGMSVRDWRYVTRIANIDVSDLATTDLYALMRQAYWRLHGRRDSRVGGGQGRTSIYCNRDVLERLDAQNTNAGGGDNFIRLRPMELDGKEVLSYRGMPIRETDALLNTEELVTFA